MALTPETLAKSAYLRTLVLGEPFIGKTQTCVATAPPGHIRIIACDGESNLQPATRVRKDWDYDLVIADDPQTLQAAMNKAVMSAIQDARAGAVQTIILDTITSYAERLEIGFEAAKGGGEDHGRSARKYHHNVASTVERLKMAPAHLLVLAHYIELEGGVMQGQEKRKGKGIVPLLMGASRKTFARRFDQVVMLEKKPDDSRIFTIATQGGYGTGMRGVQGVNDTPADVGLLWELVKSGGVEKAKAKNGGGMSVKPK